MSQENIERLHQAAVAANKRDSSILYELLAPGVCWKTRNVGLDLTGTYLGIDEVRGFFDRWSQAWEEWDWQYGETEAIGDTVLARLHLWGRGRHSGIEGETDVWQLWTFRGGRAIYYEDFSTREAALEAAGLSE